jgi:hypothetical protein
MTVFSMVQTVMDSNGWPEPVTAVASSQDVNMRQSMALINKSLTSVSFKKDWPILIREYSFNTVEGQQGYPLPPDFHHLVAPSAMDASQYYEMRGSLTAIQWYRRVVNNAAYWGTGFRLDAFNGQFEVSPIPATPDNLIFMYVTNQIAASSTGTPQTAFIADTDVPLIDEDLVENDFTWRWREKKGLDYSAEMAEAASLVNLRLAQYLGTGEIPVSQAYSRYGMPSQYSQQIYGDPPLTNGRIQWPFGQ